MADTLVVLGEILHFARPDPTSDDTAEIHNRASALIDAVLEQGGLEFLDIPVSAWPEVIEVIRKHAASFPGGTWKGGV